MKKSGTGIWGRPISVRFSAIQCVSDTGLFQLSGIRKRRGKKLFSDFGRPIRVVSYFRVAGLTYLRAVAVQMTVIFLLNFVFFFEFANMSL